MEKIPNAGAIVFWVAGVLVFGVVARVGWEIGGRLWGAF